MKTLGITERPETVTWVRADDFVNTEIDKQDKSNSNESKNKNANNKIKKQEKEQEWGQWQ